MNKLFIGLMVGFLGIAAYAQTVAPTALGVPATRVHTVSVANPSSTKATTAKKHHKNLRKAKHKVKNQSAKIKKTVPHRKA